MHRFVEIILIMGIGLILSMGFDNLMQDESNKRSKPNILFAISDDQSYPHTSAYGSKIVSTPAFDQLAGEGVLFENAFVPAPQCSPSRAAILTGRNIWQLEEAGTHGSTFPKKFPVFTKALEKSSYLIGYTGKPWAPGNWKQAGWERNPVGPEYNTKVLDSVPYEGINNNDYSGNFRDFIQNRKKGQPFFFWYGAKEPHRNYEYGSGVKSGKGTNHVDVPGFLPDEGIIRNDMLDYAVEIEWFDKHLGEMISYLKAIGEYENTIIVVTSDNGMPFPYAKANLQEWGTHVPLLVSGVSGIKKGRVEDELVSLIDLAPTFLELAGTPLMEGITGKSLFHLLKNDKQFKTSGHRDYVLTGRERHTHARPDNLGYPCRAIRTEEYLYIRNLKPERWPAGNQPPEDRDINLNTKDLKPIGLGYNDIDDSPTKEFMISNRDQYEKLFETAFLKRPSEQLFDIRNDPYCIRDLAGYSEYDAVKKKLSKILEHHLNMQGDPRMTGSGDIFESYPRFGRMRNFPGFKERGVYNSNFLPENSK